MPDDDRLTSLETTAQRPISQAWPAIRRWSELGDRERELGAVEEIFFEASGTKSFASDDERRTFCERWLGRYLAHDAGWFYVAMTAPLADESSGRGTVAGYLAGSLDDPATTPRFADIDYFRDLTPLTARYPAHLHINLAPQFRSRGWGEALIAAFAADAKKAGAPGMHVITGRGLRNVRFYAACGFTEVGSVVWRDRELVMLGRTL